MAATLLQDAVADWGSWSIGRAKPGKNVNMIPLQLNGKNVYLQTALTTDAAHSWVMCNPSVFNGTGAEERKSILIATPFRSALAGLLRTSLKCISRPRKRVETKNLGFGLFLQVGVRPVSPPRKPIWLSAGP